MDAAENTALTNEEPDKYFSYYNAKEMIEPHEPIPTAPPRDLDDAGEPKIFVPPKEILLQRKVEFFDTPVNLSVSSVQVPTNVFDRGLYTFPFITFILFIHKRNTTFDFKIILKRITRKKNSKIILKITFRFS